MKASRTINRRDFLRGAAGIAAGLTLSACGATPTPTTVPKAAPTPTTAPVVKERVTVVWWHAMGGTWGEYIGTMVKLFNESQKDVTVQAEYQGGYGDLQNKFTAAAAAKALPDAIQLADMGFPAFARNGLLEVLDDLIKGPNGLDMSDYFGVVERGRINGKLYQLPMGVSTPIFYYNEQLVKQAGLDGPPKTWNDLLDVYIPKTTQKEGGKTKIYGFSFLANVDWWWQQSYVWMHGGELSDDNWNTYLDSPQVIEFLTRFQKLFQAEQAYIPTSADGGAKGYFASGLAATMIESTGVIGSIDKLVEGRFQPQVSYLPEGPAGRKVPTGGNGLSIVAGLKPEKRDAAWSFIKWTQQPKQIAGFDQATGYLAFTKSSAAEMTEFLAKNPRNKVAVDQMAFSRPQSNVQQVPRAVKLYYDAMLQVFQANADPKTLMPQIQKQVQAVLVEEGYKK